MSEGTSSGNVCTILSITAAKLHASAFSVFLVFADSAKEIGAQFIARLYFQDAAASLHFGVSQKKERRGVALVAYFFFFAATFVLGDALFLAGFDVFLAICFSFFAAVVLTDRTHILSEHLHLGLDCGEL